jgi:putative redox protein
MQETIVKVAESGDGPFGQHITARRHVLRADEPLALGGRDTGPDPFELLLAALGSCTVMTIRLYANRKELPVTKAEVELRYTKNKGPHPGGKAQFERIITVHGDLTGEQRQRLLEIAGRCPVAQTLEQGVEIRSRLAEAGAVAVGAE